ncbi:MAG UNVERIFIED_CONTAM: hypothetical protein LVQ98_08330 [Rickettsiaceae bacterium]|jgi:hypothetical protein
MAQVALSPPIEEFQRNGVVLNNQALPAEAKLFSAVNKRLKQELRGEGLAAEFLSVEAEMLIGRSPPFIGLRAVDTLQDPNGAAVFDPVTGEISAIPGFKGISMSNTLAHEMVHGVELYCQVDPQEKLNRILNHNNVTLQGQGRYGEGLLDLMSLSLTRDMREAFKDQIIRDPAIVQQGRQPTDVLGEELGSYCMEAIFKDLKTTSDGSKFTTRFLNSLQDKHTDDPDHSARKELARDLIAFLCMKQTIK